MNIIYIAITRTPHTLIFGSSTIRVKELSIRLPFTRKPVDLAEFEHQDYAKVYITETRQLSPTEFDELAGSLQASRDWLQGKGGRVEDGGFLCIEVTAPGRPYLYINPEGHDYARYVACLRT